MALPKSFMDELRRRTTLSTLVGRKVKLVRRGGRHLGLCPFHKEKTPSFHVVDGEGFYHCFGCGVSGDAIDWLREAEGLSFMESIQQLASLAGLDIPQLTPADPEREARRKTALAALQAAAGLFQAGLNGDNGSRARQYLQRRQVSIASQERYQLGYAARSGLATAMAKLGYDTKLLAEAGLQRQSTRDDSIYDSFRDRLIFPIADARGQVVGFGGRALSDEQQPKYLNSSESPLFQKKHLLYGLPQARERLRQGLPLLVVEGYMDVIAVDSADVAAAVAPLGTALTTEQLRQLWRYDDQPRLCFDGDRAGGDAALKAILRAMPLLEPGRSLRVIFMPEGKDPDDVLGEGGAAALQALIADSVSLVEALWSGLIRKVNIEEAEQRAYFWQEIRSAVRSIGNSQMRASIGDEIENRINAMRQAWRGSNMAGERFSTGHGRKDRWQQRNMAPMLAATERPAVREGARPRIILALLLAKPRLVHDFYEQLSLLRFDDRSLENLRRQLIDTVAGFSELDDSSLCAHLNKVLDRDASLKMLLAGFERRLRFDPLQLSHDQASARLAEVIRLMTAGFGNMTTHRPGQPPASANPDGQDA